MVLVFFVVFFDGADGDASDSSGSLVLLVSDFTVSGCSTAVMLDPTTGSRIAGADPRRDCYAMAY